jgi:protein farnesyltransferase/geranylgeranyltransferase type-1 subunit alpha
MELKAPLDKELELMDELALKNMKFYQVWHHRKLLMIQVKTPLAELTYLSRVLSHDVKNYHTWAYRQWLLTHFDTPDLWEYELPFVDLLLHEDVRNNSAWHHRFFVIWDTGVREGDEDREEVLRRELRYTKEKIALAPNNLSAWNYLRGVLDKSGKKYGEKQLELEEFAILYSKERERTEEDAAATASAPAPVNKEEELDLANEDDNDYEGEDSDEEIIDLSNPHPSNTAHLPCPLAMEFLADIYLEDTPSKNIEKAKEVRHVFLYLLPFFFQRGSFHEHLL